jgi:hypothetical protein
MLGLISPTKRHEILMLKYNFNVELERGDKIQMRHENPK